MNINDKWHPIPCNLWDCIPPSGSQWITESDLCAVTGLVKGTVSYHLSTWAKQGKIHRLHHPKFDIDEAALKAGVCALAYSAYHHLNRDTPHLKTGMDPIDRSPDEVG